MFYDKSGGIKIIVFFFINNLSDLIVYKLRRFNIGR